MTTRTASERLVTVNEVKMKCIQEDLSSFLGTAVLYRVLDDYHQNGTVYVNKEIALPELGRVYVIKLYNDRKRSDQVLIRKAQ
jgi:hypothetical protein